MRVYRDARRIEKDSWYYEEKEGLHICSDEIIALIPVAQIRAYLKRLEQST